jgi:hypothetical protein
MRSRSTKLGYVASRFLWGAVVAVLGSALLVGSPMASVATTGSGEFRAATAAVGNTFGGLTSQSMPLVIDMSANRRVILKATAAVRMTCAPSGGVFTAAPRLFALSVTKKGRFGRSFGPIIQRNDDRTTTDFQGRLSGQLNHAKTKISGTVWMTATDHDATGAVTDTCTTGSLSWKAKN